MRVEKVTGGCGAYLRDVDLGNLSDAEFGEVQKALWQHGVIFFRDQDLSPEQHIAFAERWAAIDINRFFTAVEGYPKIAAVYTPSTAKAVIGGSWHTDHSYDAAPAAASILVARKVPPFGGDTCFASMTAAARALSPGLRKMLEGMKAWHSDASFRGSTLEGIDDAEVSSTVLQPVILKHPESGAAALYVNGDFTTHFEGWSAEESAPLLGYLYRFATQPAFQCRFSWEEGSVAIWDNRLVQHFAVADYSGEERLMHRITIEGSKLSSVK